GDLRWKPVLAGEIYCSPGCGMRCKRAAFDAATEQAAALAAKLGPAWKPKVWENLGWHYAVQLGEGLAFHEDGCITVNPRGAGDFWVSANLGGRQFLAEGADPAAAVAEALGRARAAAQSMMAAIAAVEGVPS
ncbi:MAG TPA: hypothetical protein VIG97_07265, partial [Luteimonas sp.]